MNPHHPAAPTRAPRRPRSTTDRRRWLPWLVLGGIAACAAAVALFIAAIVIIGLTSERRIPTGVTVAGLALGGQSLESARDQLTAFAARPVRLVDGDRAWNLSLADLGVSLDVDSTLAASQNAAPRTQLQPRLTVDLSRTQETLVSLSAQVNIPAVPGAPPQLGRAMEIPVTLDRLRVDVTGELADGLLELDMIVVEPPESAPSNSSTGQTTTHRVEAGQELALIARQYGVDMQDIVSLNNLTNPDLLYVGQELIIPAAGVYTPTQAEAPAPPTTNGRAIVVSVTEQRIYAYENGQLVRSHLVSTGRPETPTVLGDYKVYVKYVADDMSGPGYFLPQVPYTMYFYSGYAIHGTYWHNSFGRRMSHGCVNLPTAEAKWFFDFASVGTPVRVI